MKLPKYMLLTHPTLEGQHFIIRTQAPLIIGQVIHGDIEELIRKHQPTGWAYPHRDEYPNEKWAVFYAGILAPYELRGTPQEQADYIAKIMRKMSDFYLHNFRK